MVDIPAPWAFEALQQLICECLATLYDLFKDVEMHRFVVAGGVNLATVPQALARDLQHLSRNILHGRPAKTSGKCGSRHLPTQRLAFLSCPVFDEGPRRIKCILFIEQPNPKRGKGADPLPGPSIGTTHL